MKTPELIRKLKKYARKRNLELTVRKHESKGSHRRIYLGDRSTTIPWATNLKTGTIHAVLKQLNVDEDVY